MTSKTDRSEYAIVLLDETSAPAKNASRALVDLRSRIERDVSALRGMQSALSKMKGTALASSDAAKRLRDQIAAQKQRIGQAQAAYVSLGGVFGDNAGQVEGLSGSFSGLLGSMGGAAGIAHALIGAYTAMVTSIVAATVALGAYALAQADARRSELLHLEGLTTIRRYYGLAAGTGAELQGAIDRVSDSSALGRAEIGRYTEQLYRMGLRGTALESALEGVSTVAATQGDAMASRFAGMYAGLVRTGGGVDALTTRIRGRLGGLATRSALGLGRQLERLRESVGRIFADVRIEGFLNALHAVVSLFSQSTETGRALHEIVTDLFSPIFDSVGGGTPLVRRFFQGMVIAALDVAIAILRTRNALMRTFGGDARSSIDGTTTAVNAGRLAFIGLAAVVLLAAIPFALLGGWIYLAWTRFEELSNAVQAIGVTLGRAAADWQGIGGALVGGLIAGITGGAVRVRDAVRSLAIDASSTLRGALGIHSPSRVFASLGVQIPRGLAEGVETGSGHVAESVSGMGDAAVSAAPAGRGGGRGALTVSIASVVVNLASGSASEARAAGEAVVDEIVRMLEGVGVELGAP